MPRGEQQPLKRVLEQFVKRVGLQRPMRESRAVVLWADIVGTSLARVSRALRLEDGILHVRVRSSAWAQQLSLLHAQLLDRYTERVGKDVVKGFRFIVGSLSDESATGPTDPHPDTAAHQAARVLRQPAPEVKAAVEGWAQNRHAELGAIDDANLREVVGRWIDVMRKRRVDVLTRGGESCSRCGAVVEAGQELCTSCQVELSSTETKRLQDVFEDFPWFTDQAAAEVVQGSNPESASSARQALLKELENRLQHDLPEFLAGYRKDRESRLQLKRTLSTALMLKTGCQPHQVTRPAIFRALGPPAAEAWGRILEGEKNAT